MKTISERKLNAIYRTIWGQEERIALLETRLTTLLGELNEERRINRFLMQRILIPKKKNMSWPCCCLKSKQ
jgi:hypothetical protein